MVWSSFMHLLMAEVLGGRRYANHQSLHLQPSLAYGEWFKRAVAAPCLPLLELHDRHGIAVQQPGDIVIEEKGRHAVAEDRELGDDGGWE